MSAVLGISLYNLFNLHHRVIVPNYYTIRDWVGICAGLFWLMAIDGKNENENESEDKKENENESEDKKENEEKNKKRQK